MKWYEGKIPEAIQLSKKNGTLFIVYIHGADELSKKMNVTWDDEAVTECMEENGSVAIKIENTSEECKFFSQIYPVVVVPTVFCIGEGGVPLEVIGGHVEPKEFIAKIKQVEQIHTAQKASVPQQSTSQGQTTAEAQGQTTPGEQGQTTPGEQGQTTPGAEGGTGASGDQGASSVLLEEKVERAKELMKKKKEEKAQQEYEKQKEEEINRRKLGQDLQKLKQNQHEMQMKELKEQMKKEKEEERLAKEKIRQQIARDREERNARFQKEKQERERAVEEQKKEKLLEQQKAAAEEEARKSLPNQIQATGKLCTKLPTQLVQSETARIQVRFPDGSSATQTYPSTDMLKTLHNFVSGRLGGNVTMSTTFPKRKFTEEDMSKTFAELQLAPTAVIIALPGRAGTARQASSSTSAQLLGLLSLLFSPFIFLWNFLYSLFYGGGNDGAQQQQPTRSSQQTSVPSQYTRERPTTAYQRRNPMVSRQEGNVRRMTDMRDDDDDMSTYNGNSTQQL